MADGTSEHIPERVSRNNHLSQAKLWPPCCASNIWTRLRTDVVVKVRSKRANLQIRWWCTTEQVEEQNRERGVTKGEAKDDGAERPCRKPIQSRIIRQCYGQRIWTKISREDIEVHREPDKEDFAVVRVCTLLYGYWAYTLSYRKTKGLMKSDQTTMYID